MDHAGITVSDPEVALGFWRDILGLEVTGRGVVHWPHIDSIVDLDATEIEWIELRTSNGAVIELTCFRAPVGGAGSTAPENQAGRVHVALSVLNLGEVRVRLESAGYRLRSRELVRIPVGAYEGSLCAYVIGPDRVSVELFQLPDVPGDARFRINEPV